MAIRLIYRTTFKALAEVRCLSPHRRYLSDRSQKKQLPPWINVPDIYQPPSTDITTLKADSSKFKKAYVLSLRNEFERDAKPFLISHCVWISRKIDDPDVKRIHFMIYKIAGHFPYYMTSLTVARLLDNSRPDQREHILKSIAKKRVMVFDDWDNELSSVEVFITDHGLQFAPQSGASDDITYKIECHAIFHMKSRTGSASSLFWKLGMLLDSQTAWGFSCSSSGHAETISVNNALKRAKDMELNKVDLVTNDKFIFDVMTGTKDVTECEYAEVCIECINLAKEFDVCMVRYEPIEKLGIVSDMTRDKFSEANKLSVILDAKSGCLWGLPILRIQQSEKKIFGQLAKENAVTVKFAKSYYVKVDKGLESATLQELVKTLRPDALIVLVASRATAYRLLIDLKLKNSWLVVRGDPVVSSSLKCKVRVIVNEKIPLFVVQGKTLVVIFENSHLQYSPGQDKCDVIPVHIIHQSKDIPPDSTEADPFLFGYFHPQDSCEVQQSFKILIYNWGNQRSMVRSRFFALEDLINHHKPDMICIQGVTPEAHLFMQKFDWWKDFFCSVHFPEAACKSCYHLQMGKFSAEFSVEPFANPAAHMGLIIADNLLTNEKNLDATIKEKMSLVLACSAEEISPDEVPMMDQASHVQQSMKALAPYRNAILYNVRADTKFCLPTKDWVNAWHELQPTYDVKTDPLFCKMADYRLDKIETFSEETEPNKYAGKILTIRRELKEH